MKEWIEDSIDWVKDRLEERTSLDGVVLIAMGLIALLFQGIVTWAAAGRPSSPIWWRSVG